MVVTRFAVLVHCSRAVVASTSAYQRPLPSFTLPQNSWPNRCADAVNTCAEQVHLSLGGDGEMVVVFVSQSKSTRSQVDWWCVDCAAGSWPNGTAVGTASVYSHLMCDARPGPGNAPALPIHLDLPMRRNFSPYLSAPLLGLPTTTDAEIVQLQNTSSWAFDPFYRTSLNGSAVRGSGYNDPTEVTWGTGSYKNPQAVC